MRPPRPPPNPPNRSLGGEKVGRLRAPPSDPCCSKEAPVSEAEEAAEVASAVADSASADEPAALAVAVASLAAVAVASLAAVAEPSLAAVAESVDALEVTALGSDVVSK